MILPPTCLKIKPSFLCALFLASFSNALDSESDLQVIKARFVDELLVRPPSVQQVSELMHSLAEDGSWPAINYADTSRTGFQHSQHIGHLIHLARGFRHADSPLRLENELLTKIEKALDYWLKHDFRSDNWWWNEMGIPKRMADFLLLMEEHLSKDQLQSSVQIVSRANLSSSGARPGGDLLQVAAIMGKGALIKNDPHEFKSAREAIANELQFTEGRGLQNDFSLQHREDRITSTLTYGRGFIQAFADFASKISGTSHAFNERTVQKAIDFYLEGIHKSTALGRFIDPHQLNRGISRISGLNPLGALVPLQLRTLSDYRSDELDKIIAARRQEQQPDFSFNNTVIP
jgi:chondroitin AC lyase